MAEGRAGGVQESNCDHSLHFGFVDGFFFWVFLLHKIKFFCQHKKCTRSALFGGFGGLEKGQMFRGCLIDLLGAGVLGDSLGSLRHGVLGQLSGQKKTDSSLDLSGGDGGPSVVVSQTRCLSSNTLEDVVHEGVHDGHGLGADSSVRMHLLQDFVDVDGVGFPPPPPLLLLSRPCGLGLAGGLLGSL